MNAWPPQASYRCDKIGKTYVKKTRLWLVIFNFVFYLIRWQGSTFPCTLSTVIIMNYRNQLRLYTKRNLHWMDTYKKWIKSGLHSFYL